MKASMVDWFVAVVLVLPCAGGGQGTNRMVAVPSPVTGNCSGFVRTKNGLNDEGSCAQFRRREFFLRAGFALAGRSIPLDGVAVASSYQPTAR